MTETSPTNPYESPREASPTKAGFSDSQTTELEDVRQRLSELERRVRYSWVVHPNFFLRVFAVWGYWLLGYAIIAAIAAGGMFITRLFFPRW
jgi:hypothetical protein